MVKKIVVIGPESTGKSTLCAMLADYYKTGWVKEYARQYLLTYGTEYTFDNLLDIAKGQINLEEEALSKIYGDNQTTTNPQKHIPLFIDTDMQVLKVWCEFVFGKCHHWILNQIAERKYDLYLLCNVDLPWVKDELREYPDLSARKKLYHHYKDALVNQQVPWTDISGDHDTRLLMAVDAVNKIL